MTAEPADLSPPLRLAGEADLGPLDSYAHDLLRVHEPQLLRQLVVIASTPFTPIPPLVGAAGLDAAVAQRLTSALLDIECEPALAPLRATLLLHGFARIPATAYHANMVAADEADALGYPQLA